MNREELLTEIHLLGLDSDDFAVFGSGPMTARDIRDCNDIDIVARGHAWKQSKERADAVPGKKRGEVRLKNGAVSVFASWAPGRWDTDELIDTADLIHGIRFVRMDHVKDWKERAGRKKDQEDLELLERWLDLPLDELNKNQNIG